MMQAVVGPNLTHLASRTTFAGGLYPLDARHLARWVKNPSVMKPGAKMNSFGIGEFDPIINGVVKIGFTDQQIADVVAYLTTLK
jgi:cytochrome c oxidase subunit 2